MPPKQQLESIRSLLTLMSPFRKLKYRKNLDISPKFEMGLAPFGRASALRASVTAAIKRHLIKMLGD